MPAVWMRDVFVRDNARSRSGVTFPQTCLLPAAGDKAAKAALSSLFSLFKAVMTD